MCGILALVSSKLCNLIEFTEKLEMLQHRGQDSCGIAYTNNFNTDLISVHKQNSLVKDLLKIKTDINSHFLIGHTRYTTSGNRVKNKKDISGVHPILGHFKNEQFAFVFNGNIPFISHEYKTDTEFIKYFIIQNQDKFSNFTDILKEFVKTIPRAFNIIFLYKGELYAIRDQYGTRPFKIVKTCEGDIYLTSEDYFLCDDNHLNNDIPRGSIVHIDKELNINTTEIDNLSTRNHTAHCVFEHIYFMNPNTLTDGFLVKDSRVKMGHILANDEDIIEFGGDYLVSSVPNTATTSAEIFARTLGIDYKQFITKNKEVNRTFIITDEGERKNYSREKYIIDGDTINNRNIVLLDDSIVRGTTLKSLVELIKQYKPKSIHIRVTSPPITNTCNLGIDIPTKDELIYNSFDSVDSLKKYLGVDSLKYLSVDSLKSIFTPKGMCMGCINGDYNVNENLKW